MLYAGGWDPSIYLTTTVAYSDKIKWFIRMKTFCYRKNGYIDVHYHQYTPDIQNLLGEQMRHPGRVHHATISLSTVCVCMHRRYASTRDRRQRRQVRPVHLSRG
jgi:hypothetical protein